MLSDEGYPKTLHESHGMARPAAGAGDFVGLLPQQIAQHPLCTRYLQEVPVAEQGLAFTVGAIVRSDSAVSPAVRHFIAHLHRAAHHIHTGSAASK
jgi:DNA-binding transcriptional LysR family regulator